MRLPVSSTNHSQILGERNLSDVLDQEESLADYYKALFDIATGSGWSVGALRIEQNRHRDDTNTQVLEATLSHQTGSLIQIIPIDPKQHTRDSPQYEATRVRLRDSLQDDTWYVTPRVDLVDDPWRPSEITDTIATTETAPFASGYNQINKHSQSAVHEQDKEVTSQHEKRSFEIETTTLTIFTTCSAANLITAKTNKQSSLEQF